MKYFWLLIAVLVLMSSVILYSAEVKPSIANLTSDELMLLIKEELLLNNDILSAQIQILTRMLILKQQKINQKNAELRKAIDELKQLKATKGKTDEKKIAAVQKELDVSRLDLAAESKELETQRQKMMDCSARIGDYTNKILNLMSMIITVVENNKDPNLPQHILPAMKDSHTQLSKNKIDGIMLDPTAFAKFQKALDDYLAYLKKSGKDATEMENNKKQLDEFYRMAQENQKQYVELKKKVEDYESMLTRQTAMIKQLQIELDELRELAHGIPYDDKVYFLSGSAELSDKSREVLKKFAQSRPKEDYHILVTGYCDNDPIGAKLKEKYPTNWELSVARSTAVVRYLIDHLGIPADKIIIAGQGNYYTVMKNGKVDKKESRRVEIRFIASPNK